jgi:hypothetical protein
MKVVEIRYDERAVSDISSSRGRSELSRSCGIMWHGGTCLARPPGAYIVDTLEFLSSGWVF